MKKIEAHNRLFERGLSTYKMNVNKYSDLTADEFRDHTHGYKPSPVVG